MICAECWEPIDPTTEEVIQHAWRHQRGTDGLTIEACPHCVEKETGRSHPAHIGRCNMPTGHLGVVSCYCTKGAQPREAEEKE